MLWLEVENSGSMKDRVLIIDDEESILDVMTECFIEENFEVKTLLAVNDVVEVVNEFAPDVVIIDYLLRGLNGGELCHEIKLVNPDMPVVIISATRNTHYRWRATIAIYLLQNHLIFSTWSSRLNC
jgi:DNA-binding NtrC family response regulator